MEPFMSTSGSYSDRYVSGICVVGWTTMSGCRSAVVLLCGWMVFFFQAEDGIRDLTVTGVQTCALPIYLRLCLRKGYARLELGNRAQHVKLAAPKRALR